MLVQIIFSAMPTNRKAVLSYLGAVLIPLAIGIQWIKLAPAFQLLPGYIYLLLVALAARFLGFGPAVATTATSAVILATSIFFRLFPPEGAYLRLILFIVAAIVIAGVSRRESDAILGFLYEHCTRQEFLVRYRWESGDLGFWDRLPGLTTPALFSRTRRWRELSAPTTRQASSVAARSIFCSRTTTTGHNVVSINCCPASQLHGR